MSVLEKLASVDMETPLQANKHNFKRHKTYLVDSKERHQKEQELLIRSIKGSCRMLSICATCDFVEPNCF